MHAKMHINCTHAKMNAKPKNYERLQVTRVTSYQSYKVYYVVYESYKEEQRGVRRVKQQQDRLLAEMRQKAKGGTTPTGPGQLPPRLLALGPPCRPPRGRWKRPALVVPQRAPPRTPNPEAPPSPEIWSPPLTWS